MHPCRKFVADAGNRLIQAIDLHEQFGEQEAMMGLEDANQGLLKFGTFPPTGQTGQCLGVRFVTKHGSCRFAQDIGRDISPLDNSIFQGLLEPIDHSRPSDTCYENLSIYAKLFCFRF